MKRFSKILVNILAAIMVIVSCSFLVACEDIKVLEVKVNVYNTTDKVMEEKTLTVDLYRHLAPTTVDTIAKYAEEGYYNDSFFYVSATQTSVILMGDLKFNKSKQVTQNLDANTNKLKDTITGEFAKNNVIGSNLKNVEGSIGLWRSWTANGNYAVSDNARDSGRATWYMPTSDIITSHDGWFCVFGQYNMDTESESYKTYNAIKNLLNNSEYYENYVIYYTGEYVEDDSVLNNGLTFNCVPESEFSSVDEESVFVPEGSQYACYSKLTIRVPLVNKGNKTEKALALSIKSISVR